MKVAIIIPTMNRPDFMLRQFEFYESMNSCHPVYILDSSNPENAKKLQDGIKKFKTFEINYKWAPPGKDHVYTLMSLVKEKYCIQSCDDDLVIPDTISECADFLENNPDYGTCAGKQINIRLRQEDRDKPYGVIDHQTRPLGRSIEDESMVERVKNFWWSRQYSDQYFICFAVTRTETERAIRNITKNFVMNEDMFEFVLFDMLLVSGKAKVLDKLGYIMQRSSLPFFNHSLTEEFLAFPSIGEQWKICEGEFSKILQENGLSEKESRFAVKGMFIVYLAQQYSIEKNWISLGRKKVELIKSVNSTQPKLSLSKKIRNFASGTPFVKNIYYKLNPPQYVTNPASKYFKGYEVVKNFIESKSG